MEQQQIAALVSEQRAFFESGKTLCVCYRKEALKKLYEALEGREGIDLAPLKAAL